MASMTSEQVKARVQALYNADPEDDGWKWGHCPECGDYGKWTPIHNDDAVDWWHCPECMTAWNTPTGCVRVPQDIEHRAILAQCRIVEPVLPELTA